MSERIKTRESAKSTFSEVCDWIGDNADIISYLPIPGDDLVSAAVVFLAENGEVADKLLQGKFKEALATELNGCVLTAYEAIPYVEYLDSVKWLGISGPRDYVESFTMGKLKEILGPEGLEDIILLTNDDALREKLDAQGLKFDDLDVEIQDDLRTEYEKKGGDFTVDAKGKIQKKPDVKKVPQGAVQVPAGQEMALDE